MAHATGRFAKTTKNGRAQDRPRVAAGQGHEVRYEPDKKGVSKGKVKEVVKNVGNSRKKVEADLEKADEPSRERPGSFASLGSC